MLSYYKEVTVTTKSKFEIYDVSMQIDSVLRESGIMEGVISITSLHTTCAITVNENEERLLDDIQGRFLKLVPPDSVFKHNDLHLRENIPPDEPENAHAHIIATIVGNSEVISVHEAKLALGRYQSILFLEMDGPRERKISVQILGTG